MINDIRFWRGKFKIKLLSKVSPLRTVLVKTLSFGVIGFKRLGYRTVYPNELIICRVRDCWKNEKNM